MKPSSGSSLFVLLCFLFSARSLTAQLVFEPVFMDPCTGEIHRSIDWYLSDSLDNEHEPQAVPLPTDTLKSEGRETMRWKRGYAPDPYYTYTNYKYIATVAPGTYYLHFYDGDLPPVSVCLQGTATIRDTFYTEKLRFWNSLQTASMYVDCDSSANGTKTDHYYNGTVRMRGTFTNGQPVDTLFTYYPSGKLYAILIPHVKGERTITWYENGNKRSDDDNRKRCWKKYDDNGRLVYVYRDGKGTKEYAWYPDGMRKEYMTRWEKRTYSPQGKLREKISRKEKKTRTGEYFRRYSYKWITYTVKGKRAEKILFEGSSFGSSHFPTALTQLEPRSLQQVVIFRNNDRKKTRYRLSDDPRDKNGVYDVQVKQGIWWKRTGQVINDELQKLITQK